MDRLRADLPRQERRPDGAIGAITELICGRRLLVEAAQGGRAAGLDLVALSYSFFIDHYVAGLTSGTVKT